MKNSQGMWFMYMVSYSSFWERLAHCSVINQGVFLITVDCTPASKIVKAHFMYLLILK